MPPVLDDQFRDKDGDLPAWVRLFKKEDMVDQREQNESVRGFDEGEAREAFPRSFEGLDHIALP